MNKCNKCPEHDLAMMKLEKCGHLDNSRFELVCQCCGRTETIWAGKIKQKEMIDKCESCKYIGFENYANGYPGYYWYCTREDGFETDFTPNERGRCKYWKKANIFNRIRFHMYAHRI